MTKNVLYISYDGMTDPLGQSQVLPYLIGLSKNGYSFTLISCEKQDKFEKNKSVIQKICAENEIDWQPLLYHKNPPILSTLWDVYQIHSLAWRLQKNKSFKLVHCRGYIPALIGLSMKNGFGTKFLFDMRGLWADEKVDAGAWDLSKPHYKLIYQFFKKNEKRFFLQADCTVSLTHAGKMEIQSWDYMKNREDNIMVIPCCADTDLFDATTVASAARGRWRDQLGINEEMEIISYLGSIGTWYMLDEMLDFFKIYKEQSPNAKFLFITHDEHNRILKAAEERGLVHDIIIQPAQRKEVPELLSLSVCSIFFIRPTYSKIASSPTKQGEIMAMGIPIICNAGVGDTDAIVEKFHSGISVAKCEKTEYISAISKLKNTYFDPKTLRQGALSYFSLDQGIVSYLNVYSKLLGL